MRLSVIVDHETGAVRTAELHLEEVGGVLDVGSADCDLAGASFGRGSEGEEGEGEDGEDDGLHSECGGES